MNELETKQAQLQKLGRQYDDMSAAAFGPDVSQEHLSAFSRRLDALAPTINKLIREIRELGGNPGRAPEVLNNPRVKLDPILELFAEGALNDIYAPSPAARKRREDRGRMCSLGALEG
jgi:hypothetical protein